MNLTMYLKPGLPRRRLVMTLTGVILCALSVAFFRQAAFGTDPFQCLCAGLNLIIPISFGTLYMLINLLLLVVDFFMDRHYIGIATFMNLFLTGYLIDFAEWVLTSIAPAPGLALRIVYLAVGIVVMCFAASLYFTGDLGVSTYDAIAIIMANTWKLGQFKFIRIATDVCCVLIGCGLYLLGGGKLAVIPTIAGFGTIVTAFFMGPLIDFFNRKFSIPYLEKSK